MLPPRQSTGRSSRSGAALIVAMICLLLAGMLCTVLVRTALAQREQLERDAWHLQAEWLVQSALNRAEAKLESDPAYAGETWTPTHDGGVIGRVEIAIVSESGGTGRVLQMTVNVPDETLKRAHIEREVRLGAQDSSITAAPMGVNE